MTKLSRKFFLATVALLVGAATTQGACSRKEDAPPPPPPSAPPSTAPPPAPAAPTPAAVAGVTLGTSVGADKKVESPKDTFGAKDTIYASIDTVGAGKGTVLKARWTFTDKNGQAKPVHEESMTVDLAGPATHEFHITKKTPWPKGAYQVELFLGDQSVSRKAFSVN